HRQHVVAMEAILRVKLIVGEARESLALRVQPAGARLETRRAVVGQLAVELVLAGVGGKYGVVLEVAIEKAVHRRSQRGAGDGRRGLCGCRGDRWCGLRGRRWRGRATGKKCRGCDGGQREYTECTHGRPSPGWKAQPRRSRIPMQSRAPGNERHGAGRRSVACDVAADLCGQCGERLTELESFLPRRVPGATDLATTRLPVQARLPIYSSMPIRPSISTSAVNSPLSMASSRLR